MGILRKLISFLVLVAAVVILVGVCMKFPWSETFGEVFKNFNFNNLIVALLTFFEVAGNAIILVMLGFIGFSIPSRAK
ncbi:MAG: hypothetical protein IJ295_03070 [Clostridia bacterium]|nr:hypothetical protein [Clostridia bacterium]